nr:MAG TPA: hypothetical protein [Caudoviricetes sp.]
MLLPRPNVIRRITGHSVKSTVASEVDNND